MDGDLVALGQDRIQSSSRPIMIVQTGLTASASRRRRVGHSGASAFSIIASDASGPLNPTRYSSRIGAKHS